MAEANFQIKIGVETQLATLRAMEQELAKNIVRLRTLGDVGSDSLKKLERELSQTQGALDQVGGFTKVNLALGDMVKTMPVVGNLMQGLNGATATVTAAIGAAGYAWTQFNASLALGDQLQDTSEQLGVSASSLQALTAHFNDAGIRGEVLQQMLLKLRQGLDGAAAGSEPLRAAFAALGLKIEDLRRLAPDEQLAAVARALALVPGDAARSSAAFQLLGEQATRANGALRALGTEGLAGVKAFQTANGQVLGDELTARLADASQKLERFANQWTVLKASIAGLLLPATERPLAERDLYTAEAIRAAGARAANMDIADFSVDEAGMNPKARNAAALAMGRMEAENATILAARATQEAEKQAAAAAAKKAITDKEQAAALNLRTLLSRELAGDQLQLSEQIRKSGLRISQEIAAEDVITRRKEQQTALSDQLTANSRAIAALEANPLLLNNERDEKKLGLLIAQRDAVAQRLELLNQEANTPEVRAERDRLDQQQAGLDTQISGLTPMGQGGMKPTTVGEGVDTGLTAYLKSIPDMAARAQQSVMGIANAMEQGIGNSLKGLITGTMTWAQALRNIGSTIMNAVIDAVVQMFAQWMVGMVAKHVLGIGLRKAETADVIASEAATLPVKTAGAVASGISSWGLAIVGGIAALALIASLSGGFAEGGPVVGPGTGTSDSIMARLSNGEYVMPASVVSQYGQGFFDDLRAGRAGLATPAPSSGGGSAGRGGSLSVVVTGSANEQRRYLESAEGERVVIDLASRQRLSLGIAG